MNNHRESRPFSFKCVDIRRPFSNFSFVEKNFKGEATIRRLFSQSRSYGGRTLIIEDVAAVGVVKNENLEIKRRYSGYQMTGLERLTFWKPRISTPRGVRVATSGDLIGYAIVKHDVVPSSSVDRWHVFESVFMKYPHAHNYIHGGKAYTVRVQGHRFNVTGVMYCQQNELNKACAQVALRSLCSMHMDDTKISFARINRLAEAVSGPFDPAKGLHATQIQAVLRGLRVGFTDVDYTLLKPKDRKSLPYQKFVYAGIESGAGALLGFKLTGPSATGHHIIPFFGHTFNQDAWVPNAEVAYFHVGEQTRYLPSEAWLSSFIGHDDNFGSNFCVPRLYVTPQQAQYVVALHPNGVHYSGVVAEAIAVDYLYSLLARLNAGNGFWLKRLINYAHDQKVVLRAVAMSRKVYSQHLRQIRDWHYNQESRRICEAIETNVPKHLWMVEVSLPELFPANQRKLGEIVLDGTKDPSADLDFRTYVFARLPGQIMFLKRIPQKGGPEFVSIPSHLKSHTPLYSDQASMPGFVKMN